MLQVPGRHYETVTSTMEAAKEELLSLDWGWVSARQQSRGRGTQGRPWLSPPGNLYMTLAIGLGVFPRERLDTLSLEAGWVLWDCLKEWLPSQQHRDLWLKWPNDLLKEQKKVAGFLLEVHQSHVLVGLGVNCAVAPEVDDGGRFATNILGTSTQAIEPLVLGQSFANALVERVLGPWDEHEKGQVLELWSKATRWDLPLVLRPKSHEKDVDCPPVIVKPLRLTKRGHLQVQTESGQLEELIADYLW